MMQDTSAFLSYEAHRFQAVHEGTAKVIGDN